MVKVKTPYYLIKDGKEVVGTRSSTSIGAFNNLCNLFVEFRRFSNKELERQGYSLRKDRNDSALA